MRHPVLRACLLGPFELIIDSEAVQMARLQRAVCSALIFNANRAVSQAHLSRMVWGDHPPASAAARLRSLIAEIRRAIGPHATEILWTADSGYLFKIPDASVDYVEFTRIAREGIADSAQGEWEKAQHKLDAAIKLWRGDPLPDLQSPPDLHQLNELYASAAETRLEAWIFCGQSGLAVTELTRLTTEYPLREKPHALLMKALHNVGRTVDGLEVFRLLRRRLVEELGIEPSTELAALHTALLSGSTEGVGTHALKDVVPRQLPHATPHFGGRAEEIGSLESAFRRGERLIVISGEAGAGKTTLAIAWARRIAHEFPDGQIFLDLRGFDRSAPMGLDESLPILLQALGCEPDEIPTSPIAQSALLRTLCADRKLILLLDNASSTSQVRDLLPAGEDVLVLVTSRDQLNGLSIMFGAHQVRCGTMRKADCHAYLRRVVGEGRVAAEPEAAGQLISMCERLPLAMAIAASAINQRPNMSMARYVSDLKLRGRLTQLRVAGDNDLAIRHALDLSYRTLQPASQAIFRSIGVFPGSKRSLAALAAGACADEREVEKVLMEASRLHLIQECDDRVYAWHDLVREFATELCEEADGGEKILTASRRILDHYLHGSYNAAISCGFGASRIDLPPASTGSIPPAFTNRAEAISWFDKEWPHIAVVVSHAAQSDKEYPTWQIISSLHDLLQLRRPMTEVIRIATLVRDSALRNDDVLGAACMGLTLGSAYWRATDLERSFVEYSQARELARKEDWVQGEAVALQGMGVATKQQGHPRKALLHYKQATALFMVNGRISDQVAALNNTASAHLALGELEEAEAALAKALPLACENQHFRSIILVNQGLTRQRMGLFEEAETVLSEALEVADAVDSEYARAITLETLGLVHLDAGDASMAEQHFRDALTKAEAVQNENCQVACLLGLAAAARTRGRLEAAETFLASAGKIVDRTCEAISQATLLLERADWELALGKPGATLQHIREAGFFVERGAPFLTARLRLSEAEARYAIGDFAGARSAVNDAARLTDMSKGGMLVERIARVMDRLPPDA
ncbi:AfsR/SARP family transcriptional regulator [Streptomyces sp. NRRL S-37]|uniref:AfsR/SARP family transcriptional regulator n=1 Tax=Streptomyces sp. NRRL S-37 TaxID=1463903 RepID=UPI0006905EA7|nr:BTAD domain-containing putative transcriptional regulator [Streptomyces sp. NRRL S-37]